ncbi:hypothetical protein [Pullulanibacillus camelliae]|uniref:hypothetical protein n=1 Tax=Pullulanibacillus camelliae TaxID=1707096 RepID=UPI00166B2436|nr:hypothetical protein [Pullulanibacillus camelliae]
MRKSEVHELYRTVKRRKFNAQKQSASLFEPTRPQTGGCQTCGKVTWKPYKQD